MFNIPFRAGRPPFPPDGGLPDPFSEGLPSAGRLSGGQLQGQAGDAQAVGAEKKVPAICAIHPSERDQLKLEFAVFSHANLTV